MSWNGPDTTPASVRIATVFPALNSSERRVAELLTDEPSVIIDSTAQELAARAGVARSTVVRTCQSLGYPGYPQLRVAIARELSSHEARATEVDEDAAGGIRATIARTIAGLRVVTSTVSDADLEAVLDALADARRVLVVGNGLSAPIAAETALRLTSSARPAEHVGDGLAQRVFASRLSAGDVCLVLSATGADPDSVAAARAASEVGARIVALTSFSGSPILEVADLALVIPSGGSGLRSAIEQSSRVPHAVVLEALVDAVARRLATTAAPAR